MKKTTLLLFALAISAFSFAQARIGYTESQIRAEFSDYKFEVGYTDDGDKFIFTRDYNSSTLTYFFLENNKCFLCKITPNNSLTLNRLVEKYNANYVIVSETKWKAYSESGILTIHLIIDEPPRFLIY